MKSTDLMLDVGQANELKLTFRREGWSNADIKAFCEHKGFGRDVLDVLRGRAEINYKKFITPVIASNGMNKKEIVKYLEARNIVIDDSAKSVMSEIEFIDSITKDINYHITIIKGDEFYDDQRGTRVVFSEARKRNYRIPPPELGPLLRATISNEDIKALGFDKLMVMHKPIIDRALTVWPDNKCFFSLEHRNGDDRLNTSWNYRDIVWDRGIGFVFLAPQDSKSLDSGNSLFHFAKDL